MIYLAQGCSPGRSGMRVRVFISSIATYNIECIYLSDMKLGS